VRFTGCELFARHDGLARSALFVAFHVEARDLGEWTVSEVRDETLNELLTFPFYVLAASLKHAIEIDLRSRREGEGDLSPLWQIQSSLACILARFCDESLGRGPSRAVRLSPDRAVDPPTVDHDVDAEHAITVGEAFKRDSMLGDAIANLQFSSPRSR
jgi:hypothetical protein